MSIAGLAAGADGLIVEIHPNPPKAQFSSTSESYISVEQLSMKAPPPLVAKL